MGLALRALLRRQCRCSRQFQFQPLCRSEPAFGELVIEVAEDSVVKIMVTKEMTMHNVKRMDNSKRQPSGLTRSHSSSSLLFPACPMRSHSILSL